MADPEFSGTATCSLHPGGAAYNAVIEYLDHVVPVRGARTASDPSAARALRNITASGSSQSLTAQAFSMRQIL